MQEKNRYHSPSRTDYEEMRLRFNTILDLLMSEEGHALRLLRGRGGAGPRLPQERPRFVDEPESRRGRQV